MEEKPVHEMLPCRKLTDGISLSVRVTPKSAFDRVDDTAMFGEKPVLRLRVRAVPDKGKANSAAIALLAEFLGVAKSDISLLSGATSRLKQFKVSGDPDDLFVSASEAITQLRDTECQG